MPKSEEATIISGYLAKLASNIPGLKLTFLQRELVKAALRTLIKMTPL